ncbi:MAG: rod shape-determining protein, partial [Alphaproteobacteria bacterium]|nr:rod shape-determining protein [Alphaproteobacteria bacterium]MBU1755572.1 rod shape-determining protein [Alphaproteobacteria bacterium]
LHENIIPGMCAENPVSSNHVKLRLLRINASDIPVREAYHPEMFNFHSFARRQKPDLAIDLGTANMRMVVPGEGCVFDEPSLCYFQDLDGRSRFMAAGKAVLAMVDRVPKTFSVRRPLARGVLQDIEATSALLAHGLTSISGRARRSRPRALIGLPADATKAEANALLAAADDAGLGRIELIREPFAAAIGAGLPVGEARASMIVECGAGTTEIAVFSIDGQCKTRSVRLGGQSLDEALLEFLQTKHHFLIGRLTAENLKRELSVRASKSSATEDLVEVKGRNLRTGLPGMLTLTASAFDPVFEKHFGRFAEATRVVLGELSPDLAADLLDERIIATGGGISAYFLADAIERECGVPVTVAEDASGCVARGLQRLMEN